jgi:K+-transporting ATPase KdpF subunit
MPAGAEGRVLDDFFASGGASFTPSLWPASNLGADRPIRDGSVAMDWENLLALLAAVALVGYLVYTLVRPERF